VNFDRWRRSPRAWLGGLLLALSACVGHLPPRLPYSAHSDWGTVRAEDEATAREVAAIVDEIAPRVAPRVPGLDLRPLDIRIVRGFADPLWGGATFQMPGGSWMEIPVGSLPDLVESTLAHEMVHYWLGHDWDTLPAVIEEGLADLVAGDAAPEESAIERAGYAVLLSSAFSDGLELLVAIDGDERIARPYRLNAELDRESLPGVEEILAMSSRDLNAVGDRENRLLLYGFGYLFAARIGIDHLHQLCLEAHRRGMQHVPARWLYTAADIDAGDSESWKLAIESLLGREERQVLAQMQRVGDGVYRLARPGR
jgi:hypothetical protein